MSARAITLLGGAVVLGLASSFVLGNGNAGDAVNQSEADAWQEPRAPISYSNSSDRFLNALSSGKLFPNTAPRSAGAAAQEQQEVAG